MKALLFTYTYLTFSFVLLGIFVAAFVVTPAEQKRFLAFSGLFSVPTSFASFFFVPEYWDPVRVVPFPLGPEDIIFSFSTGGIAWFLAIWRLRNRMTATLEIREAVPRYCRWMAFGFTISAVMFFVIGLKAMTSALISVAVLGTVILFLRNGLWPVPLAGMVAFVVFYFIFIKITFVIVPEALSLWTVSNFWGPPVWGIPQEEIAWAAGVGAVWPLFMAFLFKVKILPQ